MTSQHDPLGPTSGVTLFETLIALSILALMAGVVVAGRGNPSPALRLSALQSDLKKEAAGIRSNAIKLGFDQVWLNDELACPEEEFEVIFYPDGSARGSDICIEFETLQARFSVDPLTGMLREAPR